MDKEIYFVKEPEFKPFDKVITRNESTAWSANIFSHKRSCYYVCCGAVWTHCLHYEGNEDLIGTVI